MNKIYLVRHAESTYSPDEYGRGLTEKGKRDAERVTDALRPFDIDLVISSPYKRAMDTVNGIAEAKNLQVLLDESFRERGLAGEAVEDFHTAIKAVWDDPLFSHPGGESNREAAERGIRALNEVLVTYHDKRNIVIGTHGNLMTLIMQHYDARYDYLFWKNELKMPDVYGLTFEKQKCLDIFHVS
ncbi:MAG: histidine phosphatase family protein [Tuberibacillus sp.]